MIHYRDTIEWTVKGEVEVFQRIEDDCNAANEIIDLQNPARRYMWLKTADGAIVLQQLAGKTSMTVRNLLDQPLRVFCYSRENERDVLEHFETLFAPPGGDLTAFKPLPWLVRNPYYRFAKAHPNDYLYIPERLLSDVSVPHGSREILRITNGETLLLPSTITKAFEPFYE